MFYVKRIRRKYNRLKRKLFYSTIEVGAFLLISLIFLGALADNILAILRLGAIIFSIFIVFKYGKGFVKRCIYIWQYKNVSISKPQLTIILKGLTPRQFEVFCAKLFKALGNKVYLMPDGPDGGKDVIVNNKVYVECKRYNSSVVGREICQKLLGAVEADGMEKGIVFTNGRIHEYALEMLKKTNRLEIWDMNKIYDEFNSLERYKASVALDEAIIYRDENPVGNESSQSDQVYNIDSVEPQVE